MIVMNVKKYILMKKGPIRGISLISVGPTKKFSLRRPQDYAEKSSRPQFVGGEKVMQPQVL